MTRIVKVLPKAARVKPEEMSAIAKEEAEVKALILVKTANKGTWKAKALARTINARRAKRGSRARISPYEMMIHKKSSDDMKAHRQLSGTIFTTQRQGRELYTQTDVHYTIDQNLGRIGRSVRMLITNTRVKVERLRFLQRRLVDLRGGSEKRMSADDEVAKHMSAAMRDERSVDTFRTCGVCSKRVLSYLIDDHQDYCQARDKIFLARVLSAANSRPAEGEGGEASGEPKRPPVETECPTCHRKFPGTKVPDKHARRCAERRDSNAKAKERELVVMETVPYPPRELGVAKVGPSWVRLRWKPPLIDGNSAVYEYEVSLARRKMSKVGSRMIVDVEPVPPLLTSRWCMASPVAHVGFKIEGLRGDSEYIDIKVRARNRVGWSDYCEPLRSTLVTAKATGPTMPTNIAISGPPTTTCIPLSWGTPYDDGGREIVDYEVYYLEMSKRPASSSEAWTGKKNVIEPREVRYRIGKAANHHVLRRLTSDTDYFDITISAVNEGGHLGAPAVIKYAKTRMVNYKYRLRKELERAQQLHSKFVETDFWSALPQREVRAFYTKRLQDEIRAQDGVDEAELERELDDVEEAAEREAREAREKAARDAAQQETDAQKEIKAKQDLIVPKYNVRKREFQYRIKYLGLEIEQAEEARIKALADRSKLSHDMMSLQTRVIELRAELDRVVTFKGDFLNSAIVHGSDQRWSKDVLVAELRRELDIAAEGIMNAKIETHHGFQVERHSIKQKAKKEQELRNRRAAFQVFEINAQRAFRVGGIKVERPVDMRKMLAAWKELIDYNRYMRLRVGETLLGLKLRLLAAAWHKWRFGKHLHRSEGEEEEGGGQAEVIGKGGVLLLTACSHRTELVDRLGDVAVELHGALQAHAMGRYCRPFLHQLKANPNFNLSEYHKESKPVTRKMVLTIEGDGFYHSGDYQKAIECYEREIAEVRHEAYANGKQGIDIQALAIAYGRRGRAYLALRLWDRAILSFDCQRLLGLEIDDHAQLAEAFLGMATGYFEVGEYQRAIELYKAARNKFVRIGDRLNEALTYRGLQGCYQALHVPTIAKNFKEQSDKIVNDLNDRLGRGFDRLESMKLSLIGVTAQASNMVKLEMVSGLCLRMRKEVGRRLKAVKDVDDEKKKWTKRVEETKEKLRIVKKEIVTAKDFQDNVFLTRSLGGGEEEAYDIEEFRIRIVEKRDELAERLAEQENKLKAMGGEIKNLQDEMKEMEADLQVESGALVQQVNKSRMVRQVAFNQANNAAYEVSGKASGGVEQVVTSEGTNLMVFNLTTGELQHIFQGDEEGRHIGEAEGHLGTITALYFYKAQAYSGSIDTTIQIWDTKNFKRTRVLRGHESTVTCLSADHIKLVSGSADTKICIWDVTTGELRVCLSGHKRSVTCVSLALERFVTGGAEGEVRVWDIQMSNADPSNPGKASTSSLRRVRCSKRLYGNGTGITCVGFNKMEVIAGTLDGHVLVWWINTGDIMRDIKPHTGPIRSMAFDATKVITGGMDKMIGLSDLVTGDVLQRLRGHAGPVQDICFDATKILSGSADCTLRYWKWGKDESRLKDRLHLFETGDTLAKIAKNYGISIADLCQWNGITDPRQVSVGMKLVVAKADPSKPTAAEEAAEARRIRAKAKATKILAAAGMRDVEKEKRDQERNRELREIHRQRTEMSHGSMSERMHNALTHGDVLDFVFLGHQDAQLIDPHLYSLGRRITGKAPKPRPSGRKGPRAETGEEEAKRGVEAEMDAIASEEYTPDEREIGKEVGLALLIGALRWLTFQVAVECLLETGSWSTSLLDRMINIRQLRPRRPKRTKPALYGRARQARIKAEEEARRRKAAEEEEDGLEGTVDGLKRTSRMAVAEQQEASLVMQDFEDEEEDADGRLSCSILPDAGVPYDAILEEADEEEGGARGQQRGPGPAVEEEEVSPSAVEAEGGQARLLVVLDGQEGAVVSGPVKADKGGDHGNNNRRESVGARRRESSTRPMAGGGEGEAAGRAESGSGGRRESMTDGARRASSSASKSPLGSARRSSAGAHQQHSHESGSEDEGAGGGSMIEMRRLSTDRRPQGESAAGEAPPGSARRSSMEKHGASGEQGGPANRRRSSTASSEAGSLADESRRRSSVAMGDAGRRGSQMAPGSNRRESASGRSNRRESGGGGNRRESVGSFMRDSHGRRTSMAAPGISSDAALMPMQEQSLLFSGVSGVSLALPPAPDTATKAPAELESTGGDAAASGLPLSSTSMGNTAGMGIHISRMKATATQKPPPPPLPSAEVLLARLRKPGDEFLRPTEEDVLIQKYSWAPRHATVGAGGIIGRLKRNANVVKQLDEALTEHRKNTPSDA